jgi:hypothetical protein
VSQAKRDERRPHPALAAQKFIGRVFHRFLQHCAVEIMDAKNQTASVARLS